MGSSGQIVVTPANIDDVISRLRSIVSDAEGIAGTSYSLTSTVGSGGEALVQAGEATNTYAQTFAGTIAALADALSEAKEEFQDADFELAAQMAQLGLGASGADVVVDGGADVVVSDAH